MKFKDLDKSVKWAFYAMGVTFILLFIATGITIHIATKDHEPVLDPNYYEKGLNYEKAYEDIKVMKQDGYEVLSPLFDDRFPLNLGDNEVIIDFNKSGEGIDEAKVSILRERGATFKFNQNFPMENLGNGQYKTNLTIPELGQWVLTIRATHKGRTLSKIVKVVVQK